MGGFSRSEASSNEHWKGRHRFEHWYRDNQVYFITARCRDRFPAFQTEQTRTIFWQRFEAASAAHGFHPWVTSLIPNHYHTLGCLENGEALKMMMQLFHGGVSKLVNDVLEAQYRDVADGLKPVCLSEEGRLVPFWVDSRRQNYFDGCLRNEKQGRLTYRYVLTQSVRHGLVRDWRDYPHTRVNVELEDAIGFALERNAFLTGVPYKRYESPGRRA